MRTACLSTMTRSRAVHYTSMVTQCTAEVCGRVGLRTQIRSNCWIHGLTADRFF